MCGDELVFLLVLRIAREKREGLVLYNLVSSSGSWSPGTKWRSTPSSEMSTRRMVPPTSRLSSLRVRALCQRIGRVSLICIVNRGVAGDELTVLYEFKSLFPSPASLPGCIAVAVDVGASGTADGPGLLEDAPPSGM